MDFRPSDEASSTYFHLSFTTISSFFDVHLSYPVCVLKRKGISERLRYIQFFLSGCVTPAKRNNHVRDTYRIFLNVQSSPVSEKDGDFCGNNYYFQCETRTDRERAKQNETHLLRNICFSKYCYSARAVLKHLFLSR